MSDEEPKVALIVGAGSNTLQRGGELDSTTLSVLTTMKQCGFRTVLIDDNPFALSGDVKTAVDENCIMPLTTENIDTVICKYQPTVIVPTLGGRRAFQLLQSVAETGVLTEHNIQIAGVPEATVRQINNAVLMNQTLAKLQVPTKVIRTVNNFQDARDMATEVGYPVIVRAVYPRTVGLRKIVHDDEELRDAVSRGIQLSQSGQVLVQQSLAGLKEIEITVIRDASGTMMSLGVAEDIDPIGIHAGDSTTVLPAQTLLDRQIQDMRNTSFAITRKLRIVGVNHLQFAFDDHHNRFYVIKISPYFDRMAAMVEQSTGYPLARVCGYLYAGQRLRDIRLDHGMIKHSAVTEPVMDRTAVRVPIFPFHQLDHGDQRLITEKKSIGTSLGIGRSFIEALIKGVEDPNLGWRSEQADAINNMSDDQLDQLLIHPQANRIFSLLEAIRRGYSCQELAELTKIDPYYFNQLRRLTDLQKDLSENPGSVVQLRRAKYWGMSNSWIAHCWQSEPAEVAQLEQKNDINRTFKEVDPSAGQYDQHIHSFYATFEQENESQPQEGKRVLVIGTGARHLGNGTADDYCLSGMAIELKRLGYLPISVDDNPNSLLLSDQVAGKRYIEPLIDESLAAIVQVEDPQLVLLPSTLVRFKEAVAKYLHNGEIKVAPLNDPLEDVVSSEPLLEFNALYDGEYVYQLGTTAELQSNHQMNYRSVAKRYPTTLSADDAATVNSLGESKIRELDQPGLYQVLIKEFPDGRFEINLCRPLPATDVAFLSKALSLNLPAIELRLALGKYSGKLLMDSMRQTNDSSQAAFYRALFPFKALHVKEQPTAAKVMGAEMQFVE